MAKLGLACPHPEGIPGEVHRTNGGAGLFDKKGVVRGVGSGPGPSPNHQPPAQTSLWSVSHSLYTGRSQTRAATRPLAPPRHLSRGESVRSAGRISNSTQDVSKDFQKLDAPHLVLVAILSFALVVSRSTIKIIADAVFSGFSAPLLKLRG